MRLARGPVSPTPWAPRSPWPTTPAQTQYTYEPFGTVTISGPKANAFQYTGRENDGTGLYYYRARYYHPGVDRFISEDPITFRGGVNFYIYGRSTPLRYRDLLGLAPGDHYKTLNEAAFQATCDTLQRSIAEQYEYGGTLYRNPEDGTCS
jgi:RHS repeat-associated protein